MAMADSGRRSRCTKTAYPHKSITKSLAVPVFIRQPMAWYRAPQVHPKTCCLWKASFRLPHPRRCTPSWSWVSAWCRLGSQSQHHHPQWCGLSGRTAWTQGETCICLCLCPLPPATWLSLTIFTNLWWIPPITPSSNPLITVCLVSMISPSEVSENAQLLACELSLCKESLPPQK